MKEMFYNCYMHEQLLYAMICSKLTKFETTLPFHVKHNLF